MKNISYYDNGGKTFDRITIVFNDTKTKAPDGNVLYEAIGSSLNGSGFFQHCYAVKGRHLGKKITFDELSPGLQQRIISYFND